MSSSPWCACRAHCSLRSKGFGLCMMALEDVGESRCQSRSPRKGIAKSGSSSRTPPSRQGSRVCLRGSLDRCSSYVVASLFDQKESVPSRQIRFGMTASLSATAIMAFLKPMSPAFGRAPLRHSGQQDSGDFEELAPEHWIAEFRDPAAPDDRSRGVAST